MIAAEFAATTADDPDILMARLRYEHIGRLCEQVCRQVNTGRGAARLVPRGMPHAAEQLGEEVAEFAAVHAFGGTPAELEAGVPVRRRREALTSPMALADGVVGGTPLGVGQHRVGLVDLTHARSGVGLLADVGVVLACQPAIGLLDVVGAGIARDAQYLVVVPELHGC